jgi:hypothetical protein
MVTTLPRLAALLGVPDITRTTVADLERAVAARIPEEADLDWKLLNSYQREDRGRRELAKDVAALANGGGGAIVLGVREDDQSRAAGLEPLPLSDDEVRRMRQVIAERTAPMVNGVAIVPVEDPARPGTGYYIIVVPRSALAPHAVRMTEVPSFAYPIRHGTTTVWLGEAEVAQRYRNRFQLARDQVDQLAGVMAESAREATWGGLPGLRLGLVPAFPEDRPMSREFVSVVADFGQRWDALALLPYRLFEPPRGKVGRRRLRFWTDLSAVELHSSGSGSATITIGARHPAGLPPAVSTDELEIGVLALLDLLCQHAAWCGARGDAVAAATISSTDEVVLLGGAVPTSGASSAAALPANGPAAEVTVPIEAVVGHTRELASSAAVLAGDLLADLGIPEPAVLDPSSGLRLAATPDALRSRLRTWLTGRSG